MGRGPVITRERIVDAAREVFLNEGPTASTASVARAAGVSEGSIFKRFATKEDLFREAMGLPDVRFSEELAERLAGLPPEQVLTEMGVRIIELFRALLPRVMMLCAHHAKEHKSLIDALRPGEGQQPAPLILLRAVGRQIERLQEAGALRDIDPEVAARVLIGAMHNYVFFEVVGLQERQPLPAASFVRGVVDLMLRGALPEGAHA